MTTYSGSPDPRPKPRRSNRPRIAEYLPRVGRAVRVKRDYHVTTHLGEAARHRVALSPAVLKDNPHVESQRLRHLNRLIDRASIHNDDFKHILGINAKTCGKFAVSL
jgi:hypothetical protein